jgi:hypothetical protein
MRSLILLILFLLSSPAWTQQPVYNFNFYNKEKVNLADKKIHGSLPENTNLINKKILNLGPSQKSGFLRMRASFRNQSYTFGIQDRISSNSSFSWMYGLAYYNRDQDYYKFTNESNSYPYTTYDRESRAVGPLIGLHHGTDIKQSRLLGVFHEVEGQILYEKGSFIKNYHFKDCETYRGDENCYNRMISDKRQSFERAAYNVTYRAGLKLNLMLFWVTPYYEISYTDNLFGKKLNSSQDRYKDIKTWGLKVELPL